MDEKERISKKMLHAKMERKLPSGGPRTRWIGQMRKAMEMRGKIGNKYNKTGSGRIEKAGDFSVIVDPCLWKQLRYVDDIVIMN